MADRSIESTLQLRSFLLSALQISRKGKSIGGTDDKYLSVAHQPCHAPGESMIAPTGPAGRKEPHMETKHAFN